MLLNDQTWPLLRAAVLTLISVLLVGACLQQRPEREGREMEQETQPGLSSECLGRMCFQLSATMSRGEDSYRLRHVNLQEEQWSSPEPSAAAQAWAHKLDSIERLRETREADGEQQGQIIEVRQRTSGGLSAVLCRYYSDATVVTWEALKDMGAYGLWLRLDGSEPHVDAMLERIETIAAAYSVHVPGQATRPPGEGVFYLRRGKITLPFQYMEEAVSHFLDAGLNLDLKVTIITARKADEPSILKRLSHALFITGLASTGDIESVYHRRRELVGMDGEELLLRAKKASGYDLGYSWTTSGKQKTGSYPKIVIEMQTPDENREAKSKVWESFLGSMRRAGE